MWDELLQLVWHILRKFVVVVIELRAPLGIATQFQDDTSRCKPFIAESKVLFRYTRAESFQIELA